MEENCTLYCCRLGGAIRLPRGRIYKTRLEAEKQLVYKPIKKERTPYDYM